MTLGKGFPVCTSFGTRGRPLPREPLPRFAFPECCTRGSLPRVFWGLPRVLLTLGEGGFSRSDVFLHMPPASCSGRDATELSGRFLFQFSLSSIREAMPSGNHHQCFTTRRPPSGCRHPPPIPRVISSQSTSLACAPFPPARGPVEAPPPPRS
jgi:hypothetical protein